MKKRYYPMLSTFLAATVLFSLATPVVRAQENTQTVEEEDIKVLETVEDVKVENAEDVKEKFGKDKTGTNPLNFTFDARLYNEYRWLNTDGNGSQNVLTGEFRAPFAGGKWQLRTKVRRVDLKADINNDGANDVNQGGMGDTDIRIMTIPYLNIEKKLGVALGVEAFLDTASDDSLGTGANSLAPFVFLAFFNPIGPGSILVPGYQQTISVDNDNGGDNVNQALIDMFLVKTWSANKYWGYVDPQIILDYEDNTEFMLVELQAGMMLGKGGQSIWAMPSFGVGTDRPYDFSLEIGYKIVW